MCEGKVSDVWTKAQPVIASLEDYVGHQDHKRLTLRFRIPDQARMLKLLVWSQRHHVAVPEIIELVLPVLRDRVKHPRRSGGVGISIAALTGEGAERILIEELSRRYPGSEHIGIFRDHEREDQLKAEELDESDGMERRTVMLRSVLEATSIGSYASAYTDRILRRRLFLQTERSSKTRRRKPYRNNVWRD